MFGSSIASLARLVGTGAPADNPMTVSEARRILHERGIRYPENSPEEVRALRVVMEGGPISECLT